jgi:septum formation protein
VNNIILASSSPYRKTLLERLQINFTTESPDIDEQSIQGETVYDFVLRLAETKASHIAAKSSDAIVIGSDQALECEGKILGKPGDHATAKRQLMAMSNKTLSFFTGLCVINTRTNNMQKDVIIYQVTFRNLKESEIEAYLIKEQPYNCAGSFMSEKLGVSLVERMQGDDPTALIGLPLISLCKMLRHQGVKLP